MIVSNRTAAFLAAVLVSALISVSAPHGALVHAQGSGYTLSSSANASGQSTSQCADLGGSWSNSTATCTVSGKGAVGSGGNLEIDSGAQLLISKGATFTNSGTIENNGTLTNSGTIENNGTLTNTGGATSYGDIVNSGTIANAPSGIMTNSGTLENEASGVVTNARDFYNTGAITNTGSWSNTCAGSLFEAGSGSISGNPIVSCGTTSTISESNSNGAPAAKKPNNAVPEALLALAAVIIVALLLWRGGVIKNPRVNSKKDVN
jgi:hypothetical protein